MTVEDATHDAADAGPTVRFEVQGKPLDLERQNRMTRRLLDKHAEKYRAKYSGLVGPSGERPTVIIRMPRLLHPKAEVVLEYPETMKDTVKGHKKAERVS